MMTSSKVNLGLFLVVIVLVQNISHSHAANQCPSLLQNEKKFKIYADKDTWWGALESCTSKGMKFAMITNNDEYSHVLQLINCYVSEGKLPPSSIYPHYVWIGASDIRNRGTYVWASTGQYMNFFSWKTGEPNHAREGEDCLFLEGGSHNNMNDAPCYYEFYYICQY